MGELALSYKVSVDSVADADNDDVLIAIINTVFRQNTGAGWAAFGLALFVPICVSIACWFSDQFLGAAVFSATAMVVVLGRILGQPREKPAAQAEEPEELRAQA